MDKATQTELLLANQALVWKAVKKYYSRGDWPATFSFADALQCAWTQLLAKPRFDPDRGALSTYVFFCVRTLLFRRAAELGLVKHRCKSRYRLRKRTQYGGGMQHILDRRSRGLSLEDRDMLERMLDNCTERQRQILLRRANGESLREIAESSGVSRERIRQLEAQAHKKCREVA